MIAAEILIPSRSPDAPAVIQAVGRSQAGNDFAQVLAQSMTAAAPAWVASAEVSPSDAAPSDALPDVLAAPTAAATGLADAVLAGLGQASIEQAGAGPASVRLAEAGPVNASVTKDERANIGPVEIEPDIASPKPDSDPAPADPALGAKAGLPMPAAPTAAAAPDPAILADQPAAASDRAPLRTKDATMEPPTTAAAPVQDGRVAWVTSSGTNPVNTITHDATVRQFIAGQPIADAPLSEVPTEAKIAPATTAQDAVARKDADADRSAPETKLAEDRPQTDSAAAPGSAVLASLVPTGDAMPLQAPTSPEVVDTQAATTSLAAQASDAPIQGAQAQASPNRAAPVLATPSDAPTVVPPDRALPDTTASENGSTLRKMPDAAAAPGGTEQGSDTPMSDAVQPDTAAAKAETADTTPMPDDGTNATPSTEPTPDRIEDAPSAATPPQPTALPPLVALIQPLIAPRTGATQEATEPATQTEISASTTRQRGLAGRLATVSDAAPKQDKDASAPADRFAVAAATNADPKDPQPVQNDGRHADRAAIDAAPKDNAADQGAPLTTTTQPLPLDNRAAPPATTPRGPETPPLDTTQSGWEAALTERITTRSTELGQEIEITLTPDNLGTVRIKLDLSDKVASVQIVTDTPQAAQLFQQSEARLTEAFNRAGLSLTSHDASSRDPGSRDPGNGGQRQGQNQSNPRAEAALAGLRGTLTAPVHTGRAANLVNIVA